MMQYIVKRGDTLSKISREAYGNTGRIGDIARLNELKNPNLILEGQTLLLPEKVPGRLPEEDLEGNIYRIKYGDSLSSIALRYLGSADKWKEIAQLNGIAKPDYIFVGQPIQLPPHAKPSSAPSSLAVAREKFPAKFIPARSFFFVVADELLPGGKSVRKIIMPENIDNPALLKQIMNPEKYGIHPIDPHSPVSMGRHVLGRTDSKYISASRRRTGSPRFGGKRYWINMKKVQESGATIHDAEAIAKDLDRIAQKTKNPEFLEYIEDIAHKSRNIDKEILIEGSIPAHAIKGPLAKGITYGVRVVTVAGIGLSVYDLSKATSRSIEEESIKPLAAESLRQAGGWAGGLAGAKIGTSLGTLVGIETGPGALLTGAAGGLIFGVGGYLGADWIADWIEE